MITHAGKRTLTLENRPYLLSHAAAVGDLCLGQRGRQKGG